MGKGLEDKTCEEQLRPPGLLGPEQRRLRAGFMQLFMVLQLLVALQPMLALKLLMALQTLLTLQLLIG